MRWPIKEKLQQIYQILHHPRFLGTDPLVIPLEYSNPQDQEAAALISATLSLGKADLIIRASRRLLSTLGAHPARSLQEGAWDRAAVLPMKYRFFDGTALAEFLDALGMILRRFGSIEGLFLHAREKHGPEKALENGLVELYHHLQRSPSMPANMVPDPRRGSCNKRMHMFLRWMVRRDAIDPGIWKNFQPDQLMMPVDTHIFRWGKVLGFTQRKAPGWKAVEEITRGFRELCPQDPLKYDFSLARVGILGLLQDWSLKDILNLDLKQINLNKEE